MKCAFILAAALSIAALGGAHAADHEVQMLNTGAKGPMVFEPDLIMAAPGDTVTFLPTDPGHMAETIPGMIPEGGEAFKGKAGQPVTMTVGPEGVYGIKCLPHYAMGMVAVVVSGSAASNLEAAKAVRQQSPKAKARFDEIFAQVPSS